MAEKFLMGPETAILLGLVGGDGTPEFCDDILDRVLGTHENHLNDEDDADCMFRKDGQTCLMVANAVDPDKPIFGIVFMTRQEDGAYFFTGQPIPPHHAKPLVEHAASHHADEPVVMMRACTNSLPVYEGQKPGLEGMKIGWEYDGHGDG